MKSSIKSRILHATRHIRYRPLLSTAAMISGALFLLFSSKLNTTMAILLAFDIGALVFLIAVGFSMTGATPDRMAKLARQQEEGKWAVLFMSLIVSGIILVALYLELHSAKNQLIGGLLLAGSSILMSWLFLAVMFALHYAHSFYLGANPAQGGLLFPGTDAPDYWDFMYFSVVLSMTFQVSDVQIVNQSIRRTALLHSMVAFFFNVIIIAITVNVVAGVF